MRHSIPRSFRRSRHRARWLATAFAFVLAAGFARAESDAELVVSLGSHVREGFIAGEPLVVHVWLSAPEVPVDEPLRIRTATNRWTDAISFTVRDSTGNTFTPAPAIAHPADTGLIVLSSRRRATATWRWSMAQTQTLAPGHYEIIARLSYGPPPNGVQTIESQPVALEVHASSASASADESTRHGIALAQGCLDEGDLNRAAAVIGDVLKQNPDNDRALAMRAHVAEQQGNLVAALADVNQALRQFEKNWPGMRQGDLEAYQMHLLNRLLGSEEPAPAATTDSSSPATAATASTSSPATASGKPPRPRPSRNSNPLANGIVIKPAGTSFAGMWVTPFGKVAISEFDGKFATYNHDKLGMVQGTVTGDTARGTWKQLNSGGQVLLKLSADGKTFSGAYTTGSQEPELGKDAAWDGTRAR